MSVTETSIIYSAPGRCGIVGNPSDMYGGSVISCSTTERATVTVADDDVLAIEVAGKTRTVRTPEDLEQDGGLFDAVLAAIEYFDLEDAHFRVTVSSDIPLRAGLSGSTAVMTALTACLMEWMDERDIVPREGAFWRRRSHDNPWLLAEIVRHIELYFLKIVCGYQDAYMCTFGSLNFVDFRDKEYYRSLDREPFGTVENLAGRGPALPILLAHTGLQRISGAVHKPIRDRWLDGEQLVIDSMLRLGHLARMTKRAVLDGDWERLGEAMTENHEITRGLGSSSEENETVIRSALDAGAFSAKLAGAGKGGTIIVLHPDPDACATALTDAGVSRILRPEPCDGVRRETSGDA
jgi:galactokinase/mevalonate kinase-like predicted kinase